ncbi:Aste57867_20281 [Aphanomyces stellatus]|uniref:Aste57867_20281 protein n=1 Tax=Aphanomyces stellatus TaxID=120398 RepID=A0A485LGL5_9STRA|nr:hypothetical protein As57867_020215 [Aphanomyces stellatus]VFT96971.1 Aste57867_20281 [Aphanomyces stellatus]
MSAHDGKVRLNPMELKRQRLARRQQSQGDMTTTKAAAPLVASSAPEAPAGSTKESKLEDKLNSIYAKAREERPMKRRITQFPESFHTKDSLPMDWTLKSKMICITPFRFPPRLSGSAQTSSVRRFVQSPSNALPREEASKKSPADLWHTALHQYVHPSTSLPPQSDPTATALEDEHIMQRLRNWQDAFRSLYYAFHHERQDAFYLATPHSVVCFYRRDGRAAVPASFRHLFEGLPHAPPSNNPSDDIREHISVAISHSSSTLRRDLTAAGVSFLLPFATADDGSSPLFTHAQRPPHHVEGQQVVRGLDSLLLVKGPSHVHGVYDLLLNQPGLLSSSDVPLLCARFPFQHASIIPLHVTSRGKTSAATYKLEVTGCILPPTLHALVHAMQAEAAASAAAADMTIVLEPWHGCTRLNVCGWDCDVALDDAQLHAPEELDVLKRHVHEIKWTRAYGYHVVLNK